VSREQGIEHAPYESRAMARGRAEAEALTTWEIVIDDEKLVDWNRPTERRLSTSETTVNPAGYAKPDELDADRAIKGHALVSRRC
jgi:hypothetical protein